MVDGLGLSQHQLAHHLLDGAPPALDWEEQPTKFHALVTLSINASVKVLLLRMTLTEEKMYCLTVIGNNVTVLHAMMEPFKLQALGTSARW